MAKERAMQSFSSANVRDKDGLHGTVISVPSQPRSDATQVQVRLDDGRHVAVPVDALIQQPDGSYYLPLSLAALERADSEPRAGHDNFLVVPVIAEELDVQKRVVETGKVRITKVVHEHQTCVDEPLVGEEVEVTRVPIQRVVDGPIPVRYEDDTVIVSILEEVLVVEKRLRLKEELHIRKRRVETHRPQHITLRSEEALVERLERDEAGEDKKETR
jgi:uncharacterized protein (TIGR02271 family)